MSVFHGNYLHVYFWCFYNFMQLVLSFFLQNTGNKFSTCIFLL